MVLREAQPPGGQSSAAATAEALVAERAVLLANVGLFSKLDRVTVARIAAYLEPMDVRNGEAIVRQGESADAMYLVSRGKFGVWVAASSGVGSTRIATLSRGDCFGEMALLVPSPRSATVLAESDGEVLSLERARFDDLVHRQPAVALAFTQILTRRLRSTDSALHLPRIEVDDDISGAQAPLPLDVPSPEAAAADGVVTEAAAAEAPAVAVPVAAPDARPVPAFAWFGKPWRPGRTIVGLALAAAVILLGWVLPPPPELSPAGWHALATLLAAVPLLALGSLPEGMIALALAGTWIVGGVAAPKLALGGFATNSWVMIVAISAVGAAIASSGLLFRMALWAIARTGGAYAGQVVGLSLAGFAVSPAVPNATSRVTLVAPAVAELIEVLGHAPGSRAAAGLAMAVLFGFGQVVGAFLTSSSTGMLIMALLPEVYRQDLNFGSWAVRAAPVTLVLLVGGIASLLWLYRPEAGAAPAKSARACKSDVLALQRALLGPPSRQEKIATGVALFLLVGFVTQPLHGVDPAWIGAIGLAALAGTGVLGADGWKNVNWNFVLLFGVLTSMSDVFGSTKLDKWLASVAASTVGGLASTPILFVVALTLLCFALSLVVRWQAAAPLLTLTFVPVAVQAGINPWIVGLIALIGCNGFFLPYQSTAYLALYHGTGGKLFTHAQARPAAIAYGIVTLLALAASVPAWHLMGLL